MVFAARPFVLIAAFALSAAASGCDPWRGELHAPPENFVGRPDVTGEREAWLRAGERHLRRELWRHPELSPYRYLVVTMGANAPGGGDMRPEGGFWVTFEVPLCYVPARTRSQVYCSTTYIFDAAGALRSSHARASVGAGRSVSGQGAPRLGLLPERIYQRLDQTLREEGITGPEGDLRRDLDGLLEVLEIHIEETTTRYFLSMNPRSGHGHFRDCEISRLTGALVMCAVGHRAPDPSDLQPTGDGAPPALHDGAPLSQPPAGGGDARPSVDGTPADPDGG